MVPRERKLYIFPPWQNIRTVTQEFDGEFIVLVFDGRRTLPFEPSADLTANDVQFEDGGPPPDVKLPQIFLHSLTQLIGELASAAQACIQNDAGALPQFTTSVVLFGHGFDDEGGEPGHESDTENTLECAFCEISCGAFGAVCLVAAVVSAELASPLLAAIVLAVGVVACAGLIEVCIEEGCNDEHTVGASCCEVACGEVATREPQCCFETETCLDPEFGLCCSSGTTPCDRERCCFDGIETCIESECCPNEVICGTTCCRDGTCMDGSCCPRGQECGSSCCDSLLRCADPATGACTFLLGELTCATDASVDRSAPAVPDAFDTPDANYGQEFCVDQFVYEVPVDLVAAQCEDIEKCQAAIIGLWSSVPIEQCANKGANTAVFVLTDQNQWFLVDNVVFDSVPIGDGCFPRARDGLRTLPVPEFAQEDEFYPGIHVLLRNLTSPALPAPIAEVRAIRVAVRAFDQEIGEKFTAFVSVRASEANF